MSSKRATFSVIAALVVALVSSPVLAADGPVKSAERVVLQTAFGDIVIALYPKVAPRTVRQFERLIAAGAYDGTHFVRVEPGFVIQLSTTDDRPTPLSPEQKQLVEKLPLEGSSLRHAPYVLSLAHPDLDPNAGETSFSILTGPAPHLDGKYTIFGEVVDGTDVVSLIERAPADSSKRPLARADVTHAFVVPAAEVASFTRRPALRPAGSAKKLVAPPAPAVSTSAPGAAAPAPPSPASHDRGLALAVAAVAALGLAIFVVAGRSGARLVASFGLIQALIGFVVAFAVIVPDTNSNSGGLAVLVFLAALLTFKLMGQFEKPR